MGTASSLPADVLTTHVAKYSFRYPSIYDENLSRKWDFLGLRATCKLGADLMRRYVSGTLRQDWLNLQTFSPPNAISYVERWGADPADMAASARHVRAVGTVIGAACKSLKAHGRSPEKIAALEYFVFRTNGGLSELDLSYSHVSPDLLLRMCRVSPKLTTLQGPKYVVTPDATIVAISAACTDLKFVDFSQVGKNYSPAETWQRHFPGLNFLKLSHDSPRYLPTRLDVVREVALTRPQITGLDIASCYVTARVIEAIVGTPLGDQLDEFGADDEVTVIEPEAFLAAARGFPELAHLVIPRDSMMGGPNFYIDLSRTTANITSLQIKDDATTDACIAAACSHLRLESLELDDLFLLSSSIVDAITRSRSAATLVYLNIANCAEEPQSPLRAADVLRLLQGCPALGHLNWFVDSAYQEYAGLDRGTCQAIYDLLESRGATIELSYFGQLDGGETPWCIVECG